MACPGSEGFVVGRGRVARIVEHIAHACHGAGVEVREGLVEGGGAREHPAHGRHGAGVEVREGLVEGGGIREHQAHVRHGGSIPGS